MYVARRIALRPSQAQRVALAKAAGCARWAWNWGLRRKIDAYRATGKSPSAVDLHRELNRLKTVPVEDGGVPWMYESSKCAPQEAFRDLDGAFGHFYRRLKLGETPGFPRFKAKRHGEGQFRLTGTIRIEGGSHLRLPVIGRIRIAPGERGYAPDGSYTSVSLVQEHGEWFASVRLTVETPEPVPADALPSAAVDLGVRKLAVVATDDGTIEVFANHKALLRAKRKLRAAHKKVSRRQKDSGRRRRATRALQRVHRQARNVRRDATHKLTHHIAQNHAVVAVEDLNLRKMTASASGPGRAAKAGLNRALLDANLGEVLRQLEYKLALHGGRLVRVDPAYTSQRCATCGAFTDCGAAETFTCAACGAVADRDANAARNIFALSRGECDAASWTESINARGEVVRRQSLRALAHTSMKREHARSDA